MTTTDTTDPWWDENNTSIARQFPVGGVAEWYRPFEGLYPCAECGAEVPEADLVGGMCCSGSCYGRMVGVPCG